MTRAPRAAKSGVPSEAPILTLHDADYRRLLAFRTELRDFLRWSEDAAHEAGLTPSLHQLLLVIRGHSSPAGPTIGEAAEMLHIRHHSLVELAQRAEAAGLIWRVRDKHDQRRMRLRLTESGHLQLDRLTRSHLPRITKLAQVLERCQSQSWLAGDDL